MGRKIFGLKGGLKLNVDMQGQIHRKSLVFEVLSVLEPEKLKTSRFFLKTLSKLRNSFGSSIQIRENCVGRLLKFTVAVGWYLIQTFNLPVESEGAFCLINPHPDSETVTRCV